MKYHVLLLEDVTNHGRKGELSHVAPGFARNYLLPQGKAVLASYSSIKLQAKLKAEREEQAKKDKIESEKKAATLKDRTFSTIVKVDVDGHMYGSVTSKDIVTLLFNEGVEIERKNIVLHLPLKFIGKHEVPLRLPENVMVTITVEIKPDRIIEKKKKAAKADLEAQGVEGVEQILSEESEEKN